MSPGRRNTLALLVASSDPAFVARLREDLLSAGEEWFALEAVDELADVFERLAASRYDVLVADWKVRGMSLETIAAARAKARGAAILLAVRSEDSHVPFRVLRAGADECIRLGELRGKTLERFLRSKVHTEVHTPIDEGEAPRVAESPQIDDETGLYNAEYFSRRLEKEMLRSERNGEALTLALLEADDFEKIRRSLAPREWAGAMRSVGLAIQSHLRRFDEVARLGEATFGVLAIGIDPTGFARVHRRLVRELEEREIRAGGRGLRISLDCGAAGRDESTKLGEDLMRRAEAALERAVARGGGALALHDEAAR